MAGPVPFRACWCRPVWLVLLVGLGPLSCTKNDQPLFPVHGQLFFEGEPLPRAVVVFHPLSDPSAVKPRAVVEADGSFKVFTYTAGDGAPAGENAAVAVAISPDGRFAYVPTEDKKAISVFSREAGR